MLSLNRKETMDVKTPIEIECPDWCNTESKVMQYNLTWTVSNGISLRVEDAVPIESLPFCMGDSDEIQAHLTLYPESDRGHSNHGYVGLYPQFVTRDPKGIDAKLRFKIKPDSRMVFPRLKDMSVGKDASATGFACGIPDILEEKWLDLSIEVVCDISLVVKRTSTQQEKNDAQVKVLDDFKLLYETKQFSDLTLIVGGHHVLSAHKNILAARSPVFAAMLQCEMEEKKSNEIHISDLEPEVITAMLYFIYTGKAEDIQSTSEGLLMAADKYGLDELKEMCEHSLSRSLTVENASRIFQLADLQRAVHLKSEAISYIIRNIYQVQKTDGWKLMKKNFPLLIVEAFVER